MYEKTEKKMCRNSLYSDIRTMCMCYDCVYVCVYMSIVNECKCILYICMYLVRLYFVSLHCAGRQITIVMFQLAVQCKSSFVFIIF